MATDVIDKTEFWDLEQKTETGRRVMFTMELTASYRSKAPP